MNEIRKNKETEVEILQAKFEMPKIMKIIYCIFVAIIFIVAIIIFVSVFRVEMELADMIKEFGYEDEVKGEKGKAFINAFFSATLPAFFGVACCIIYSLHKKAIQRGKFIVTNKAIKGVTASIFSKKNYQYRLDEIENIETISSFGIQALALHFSGGNLNSNTSVVYGTGQNGMRGTNILRIFYLVNIKEVYDRLAELLENVKNDKDVAVDIEMKKIEVEERKVKAFETLAFEGVKKDAKSSSDDSISKLEKLAEMKERGLISESEYELKKTELLNRI